MVRHWLPLSRILVFIIAAASSFGNAQQAAAQVGVVLENVGAVYEFGRQIIFHAAIKSSIPIQSASIAIIDEGHGITYVQPLAVNPDGSTQYLLDAQRNKLLPFTFVRWRYDITLTDGTVFQSETYFIRYDDNRFPWQRLESNTLRVSWIQGDSAFAQNALNAAQAGVRKIDELFPVDLSQPIDMFIYPSQTDLAYLGAETWTAGHANPSLGVTLVVVEPGLDQSLLMEQLIPHELMHILLYRHIGAGYNDLPAFLREGLAAMVEINPTSEYDRLLRDAGRRGTLIPLPDLCASFPADPASAFLAYAEARSFALYLRESYGSSKLIELARTYADGVVCLRGIEIVYGTSLAQLEFMWKQSVLGQGAWGAALQNMLPYLILCVLVLGIPLTVGFNAIRRKGRS